MLLEIKTFPDPVLREVAQPVKQVDDEVKTLISNMFETMYAAPGVGLAAQQVGETKRIVVIDLMPDGVRTDEDREYLEAFKSLGYNGPMAFVNPEIIEREGQTSISEGCLSLPETEVEVNRSDSIRVTGLDREGQPFDFYAHGYYAIVIQHELDHLDAKLLIDYLPGLKKKSAEKKLKKIKEKAIS